MALASIVPGFPVRAGRTRPAQLDTSRCRPGPDADGLDQPTIKINTPFQLCSRMASPERLGET